MRTLEACLRVSWPLALVLVAACGGAPDELELEAEELGEAGSEVEGSNALTPNALTPNALTPNALTPNALTPNALTPNALTPNAMTAIQDPGQAGTLSRQLMKYVVACALDKTQSFAFSWTDALGAVHYETFSGELGLATSWASSPIGSTEQEWVSACLGMKTNYYGVSVTISARASHPALNKTGSPELTQYATEEGAFFGNLFGASPHLYACNKTTNASYARSKQRECAAGHLNGDLTISECGIIDIIGSCDLFCAKLNAYGKYRPNCSNNLGFSSQQVISVFLD